MKKCILVLFIFICLLLNIGYVFALDEDTSEEEIPDEVITYKIIFDTDGGVPTVAPQDLPKGSNINPPSDAPAMDGFTFKMWALVSPFKYGKYALYGYSNTNFPSFFANKDYTFHAVWQSNVNTVTFNANGGKINGKDYDYSYYVKYDGKYGVVYPKNNPTFGDKEFLGWTYGDSSCSNESKIYGGTLRSDVTYAYGWSQMIDRIYYACWKDKAVVPSNSNNNNNNGNNSSNKSNVVESTNDVVTTSGNDDSLDNDKNSDDNIVNEENNKYDVENIAPSNKSVTHKNDHGIIKVVLISVLSLLIISGIVVFIVYNKRHKEDI